MEVTRMKAAAATGSLPKPAPVVVSVVNHGVNMRGRMNPPLPNVSFGNIVTVATATSSMGGGAIDVVDESLDGLVSQLRSAIKKIDGDYIGKLQSGEFLRSIEEYCRLQNDDDDVENKVEVYWMTSWCKFPIYESDFGWGKPILVSCSANQPYKNVIVLMDTRW
ncbi:Transferase [Macleaya cordata]|uniref:Transferase n=1 Tax=Macleaya cordata TaxID=56857 RepID=A0A200RCP8_MACCD|nr:Transferase [Macleaya cordata]